MDKELINTESLYDPDLTHPDLLLDSENPVNDRYMKSVNNTQRLIMALTARMRPRHVNVIKKVFAGISVKKIAEEFDLTPTTVSNIKKREDAKQLLNALAHYQASVEGPSHQHRLNMLWRIAVNNEEFKPTVAISALAEVNRMTTPAHKDTPQHSGPTITINQTLLPQTSLDHHPPSPPSLSVVDNEN